MRRRTLLKRTATTTTALGFAGSAAASRTSSNAATLQSFSVIDRVYSDAESSASVSVDGTTITIEGTVAPVDRFVGALSPTVSLENGTLAFDVGYESREAARNRSRRRSKEVDGFTYTATVSVTDAPGVVETSYVDETSGFERFRGYESIETGPDWEFVIMGRDVTAKNNADITKSGSDVTVDGVIVGSSGCTTAVPDAVVVDDGIDSTERGRAEIDVTTRQSAGEDEVCTQALVGIDYRLAVEFDTNHYEVTVAHDGETTAVYPQVEAHD